MKAAKQVVAPTTTPDPAVLRNPYLDGMDALIKSRQTGIRSLRINRGAGVQTPIANQPNSLNGLGIN